MGDYFELDRGTGRRRVVLEVGTKPGPQALERAQVGASRDVKELTDDTLIWMASRGRDTYHMLGGVYIPGMLDPRAYLWMVKLNEPSPGELLNLIRVGRLFISRLPWYTLAEVDPSSQPARGLVEALGFKALKRLDDRIVYEVA